MINTHELLNTLKRPKILIQAARLGLSNYSRDADLRFITKTAKTPRSDLAIQTLLSRENDLESCRKEGQANYSVQEHIRVLTALLAEARLPLMPRKSQTG